MDGTPFGNLYLADKRRGDEFTAEDEQAVVRLAELVGIAIERLCRDDPLSADRTGP